MGRGSSKPKPTSKLSHNEDDIVANGPAPKALLLGGGENGKSTLQKQTRLIFGTGFTDKERKKYVLSILNQVQRSIRALLELYEKSNALGSVPSSIMDSIQADDGMTGATADWISSFWGREDVQKFFIANRFKLNDFSETTSYFLERLPTYLQPDYAASDDEIVRIRDRTTGINELRTQWGGRWVQLLDVGGRRSERKKWLHAFNDVTAIFFCASLAAFDLLLYEDPSVNRMSEEMKLFRDVSASRPLLSAEIHLFFTKREMFEEKIRNGASLQACFPDWDVKSPTVEEATEYIKNQFLSYVPSSRPVHVHVVNLLDRNEVEATLLGINLNLPSRLADPIS